MDQLELITNNLGVTYEELTKLLEVYEEEMK